jgi:mannosyl-3-phosphoglycerate synthase
MLLETSVYKEIFGDVVFHEVQKVIKLDTETEHVHSSLVRNISRDEIADILGEIAIIVPTKNERIFLLDGVLKAIPHKCPIIIVSGSDFETPNNFKMEVELAKHIYSLTHSKILIVHQKDPGLGEAFKKTGYTKILDKKELVRDGKGEGMLIGILLAKYIGSKYVGFIDADNYIPGSVNEYVKDYAAGFLMSDTEHVMVRLAWRHKPKVRRKRLYFSKWGRVSETTNRFLNILIAEHTGFETNIIVTGNAGEHAMSIKLAEIMEFSTGYSIEPYQIVFLLERILEEERKKRGDVDKIEVFQIETLNPHIHEEKGEDHINNMLLSSLSTIYHSKLSSDSLKERIVSHLKSINVKLEKNIIPKPFTMPPLNKIDFDKWKSYIEREAETFIVFEP